MNRIIRRCFEDGAASNAGGVHDNPPPRRQEKEAAKKEAKLPGSKEEAAGMDHKENSDNSSAGKADAGD